MTAVTIPPELAADVEARAEAYQPNPIPGVDVLVLAHDGDTKHPRVGTDDIPGAPYVDEDVTAWALVGSVDGGPRPEVGQRVLVLTWAGGSTEPEVCVVTATEPTRPDVPAGSIEVRAPGGIALAGGVFGAHYHATRWALLPEPAQDAPSAPLPATATPDPASAEGSAGADAADDVSQRALRNAEPGECGVCGGRLDRSHPDGPCAEPTGPLVDFEELPDAPDVSAVVERIQRAAAADERGPYVPVPEPVATRNGRPAVRILGDYVCWDTGNCNCATGPNGEHEPHCGLEPIVHIEELRRLGFTRPAGIPPGRWRVGSHAPRNLWVGGAHPEGVDVGRMDTPELAAYVVQSVNDARDLRRDVGHLEGEVERLRGAYDSWRKEAERLRAQYADTHPDPVVTVTDDRLVVTWPSGRDMWVTATSELVEEWAATINTARDERDEARAEVERLTRDLATLKRTRDATDRDSERYRAALERIAASAPANRSAGGDVYSIAEEALS